MGPVLDGAGDTVMKTALSPALMVSQPRAEGGGPFPESDSLPLCPEVRAGKGEANGSMRAQGRHLIHPGKLGGLPEGGDRS